MNLSFICIGIVIRIIGFCLILIMSVRLFSIFPNTRHRPTAFTVVFLLEPYTYEINVFFPKWITSSSYRPMQWIAFILILIVRFDTYIDIYGSDEHIVSIFRNFVKHKQTGFSLIKTCSDNVSAESFCLFPPHKNNRARPLLDHRTQTRGGKLTVYPPGRGVAPTDGGEILYVRNSVLARSWGNGWPMVSATTRVRPPRTGWFISCFFFFYYFAYSKYTRTTGVYIGT